MILSMIKKNKLLVLVVLVYAGIFIFAPETALKSVNNSMYYLLEMIQVLPIIFLLTVLIDAWIPKEWIIDKLGDKSGFMGNVFSILLGSLSAGPIYAAFPLSKMLLKKGASITNIVIILSAWAVIKVPMLLNEMKFLSIEFMAIRWVLTVVAILIMGYLMGLFVKKKDLPEDTKEEASLSVNTDYCNGCGICIKIAPEHFEMVDGKANVKTQEIHKENRMKVKTTIEKCPVNAIGME
ncbi:MAG: permease [Clostridiales bacterium]|nr:permease [Clostridiales bacterium]